MSEITVTITQKEYQQLLDDALFLNCLRNAGVDNWEGFSDASQEYHAMKEVTK